MKKNTFYFSHDYNCRSNDKIKTMIRKHGMVGYGVYWAIIEDLYNNANALRLDCERIAYELRTHEDIIKSIIYDFDLFAVNSEFFSSNSVESRLKEREEKSANAKKSADYRWGNKQDDANALHTNCERIAIKERKGKEIKIKETNYNIESAAKAATRKTDSQNLNVKKLYNEFVSTLNDGWNKPIVDWLRYKMERKEYYRSERSLNTLKTHLNTISDGNIDIATEIVNQSIANGYKGLFKRNKKKSKEHAMVIKTSEKTYEKW